MKLEVNESIGNLLKRRGMANCQSFTDICNETCAL